jgi:cytochrome c biogenesis factor
MGMVISEAAGAELLVVASSLIFTIGIEIGSLWRYWELGR